MKVVINSTYGGFGLSDEAFEYLIKKGWTVTEYTKEGSLVDPNADIVRNHRSDWEFMGKYDFARWDNDAVKLRTHPDIIEVVEKLGKKASDEHANLKIVKVPDGTDIVIEEYDGNEWISEEHETWC